MVVVAFVVRDRIDDDDANGGASGGDATLASGARPSSTSVCNDVSTRATTTSVFSHRAAPARPPTRSSAAPTRARRDVGFDAWLVPQPWPEIVDVRRAVNGLEPVFVEPTSPVARIPLVLAVRTDRVPRARAQCGNAPAR